MLFEWERIKRAEAVALLKELSTEQLIQPSIVLIEQRCPDSYQLRIKGDYNLQEIGILLKNRFSIEESKNCLTISSL
jgi:hypothetical protein